MKAFLRVVNMVSVRTFDDHIVYVTFHISTNLPLNHLVNHTLIGVPSIEKFEWNYYICIHPIMNNERSLRDILFDHGTLVIS